MGSRQRDLNVGLREIVALEVKRLALHNATWQAKPPSRQNHCQCGSPWLS